MQQELVPKGESSLDSKREKYRDLQGKYRFAFLFLVCFAEFGRYYCVDLVAPLQDDIKRSYDISNTQYNALYSVYALPNMVLPFLMGYVIDYVGRPMALVTFIFFVGLGQSLFAWSAHETINSYVIALIGRFFFGAFGKSVAVAQSAYISDWFKNRELALGFAMTICIARSGTVLNFIIAPKIYNETGSLAFAFWVGTAMMGLSWIAGIGCVLIDQHVEMKSGYTAEQEKTTKVTLKDMKNFTGKFWLVVTSLVGFYMSFLCFVNISADFARVKFGFGKENAGLLASLLHLIAAAAAPFIGIWIDKFGRRTIITTASCGLLMAGHLYYTFLSSDAIYHAIIGYSIIGISYCFFGAASWPMIPYVVDDQVVGTAYGIAFCCENMGSIFGPLVVGWISDSNKVNDVVDYTWVSFFLACGAAVGFIISLLLLYVDLKDGGVLMSSDAAGKQKLLKEKEKATIEAS